MRAREGVDRFLDKVAGLDDYDRRTIFISIGEPKALLQLADEIDARPAAEVPLRGLVLGIKDNIDVAGMVTTAGCPAFGYRPERSAVVVERLIAAGAVPVAKTNLDQFATGLVGTRSPYGPPLNPIDPTLVPGGSSCGSAVAVARGLVDLALGTDTAGSGRVPAAFCGIFGLKPTPGRIPITGVVPAVRSADCVSVFSRDIDLAVAAMESASGPDVGDPFSRPQGAASSASPIRTGVGSKRVGIVDSVTLADLGVEQSAIAAYTQAVDDLGGTGPVELINISLEELFRAGDLLYGGPSVAERTVAVGEFIDAHRTETDPTVAAIVSGGAAYSATDAYRASYELAGLRRSAAALWNEIDAFMTPTVPRAVTLAEVAADPLGPNSELGRFTTFANLVDLCGVTVPVPTGSSRPDLVAGPTASVTLYGPAWTEAELVALSRAITGGEMIRLVVAGAHLKGQPLETQLLDLGAIWEETTVTAPNYRMYALPGGPPFKPALIWDPVGAAIEVDTWLISPEGLGRFLTMVPAPLALGTVTLADGSNETGFVAEPRAVDGATDITEAGGWRNYLEVSQS